MLVHCVPSALSPNALTCGFPGIHEAAVSWRAAELIVVAVLKYCPTFESQCKSCLWWHVIRQRAPVPLKAYHQWDCSGIFMYVFVWIPWNATVTISHTCRILLICCPEIRLWLTAHRWLGKYPSNSVILSCALEIWGPGMKARQTGSRYVIVSLSTTLWKSLCQNATLF